MDLSALFNRDPHTNIGHDAFQTALSNYMNTQQAAFEPMKARAEAASKLAYANLMGPQFLSKLMGNENILANIPDAQKTQALNMLYQAGSGQPLNPQAQPPRQSGGLLDKLAGMFSSKIQPQQQSIGMAQPQQQADSGYSYDQQGNNIVAPPEKVAQIAGGSQATYPTIDDEEKTKAINAWMQSPEAKEQAKREGYYKVPDNVVDWYRQQLSGQQPQKSFAENVADYKSIVREGEKKGDIRAEDLKQLNNAVATGTVNETTFDELSKILSSPTFEQIRQLPLAQQHEIEYYAKEGTPEQQQIIGQYKTLTGNIIKDSSRDFAGQFRQGEQQLLEGMKPNPSDTIDVAKGKTESLAYLNKMVLERSRIASELIDKYHINKLKAMEIADKQTNGNQIRQVIHEKLNPRPTESDIQYMAEKYKISVDEVKNRLKKRGML